MREPRVVAGTADKSRLSASKLRGWFRKVANCLYGYRPRFKDRHFWAVQGLVIAVAVTHVILEQSGHLSHYETLYFLPVSLFLMPVVYAALNFGSVGSIPTAVWATIITIPDLVLWHHGLDRWGLIFQTSMLFVVAVFVGQRVDRETSARRQVENASAALKSSEMKYQRLFESSPIAILILSSNGAILAANPTAGALFDKSPETLKSMAVAELIGKANEQKLLASPQKNKWEEAYLVLGRGDGSQVYLEPEYSQVNDLQGNMVMQVLLKDVTEERQRRVGLRAYTASVLRAQEEERQHISRELHDETVQTLALLVRRLDSVENTNVPLPHSAIEELHEARRIAEEVVKGLRDFARRLRPPILDDLGLVTSIRRLLLDFTERTGVEGQLELVGEDRRLPQDTEANMYRIAQEALWNVEHHSRATQVHVTMTFNDYEARLEIRDNGIGFNVQSLRKGFPDSDQLGLLGIQERAALLGGKLEIQSSPGKGTTVSASIPIAAEISQTPGGYLHP